MTHNQQHEEGHLCDDCRAELHGDVQLMLQIINSATNDDVKELSNNLLYSFLMELYGVCDCEEEDDDNEVHTSYSPEYGTVTTSTGGPVIEIKNIHDLLTSFGYQHKSD